MPLTPRAFRENLAHRFSRSFALDERVAADLRARMPEAVRLIVSALGPRRIVLYGSLATGLFFAAHSDVDLAIEGLGEEPSTELAASLRALFGRKVDLVDPALVTGYVHRDIEERGVVLYEPEREGPPVAR